MTHGLGTCLSCFAQRARSGGRIPRIPRGRARARFERRGRHVHAHFLWENPWRLRGQGARPASMVAGELRFSDSLWFAAWIGVVRRAPD
ncbi:hypothetical protein I543_3832 [Mycobacteroides abscessus 21]|uniref:Uncharacterized protein n=1 Tax=Mycobacteroides abscessus 21 TaxID=1299324 RepID=A0A829Q0Z1_9MYCO|nr:hypothetical protein I543_3832 [Mycobacteroides abscessus 21]